MGEDEQAQTSVEEGSEGGRGIYPLPRFVLGFFFPPLIHPANLRRRSPADGSHNEKPGRDGLVKESLCFYLQAYPGGGAEVGGLT